MKKIDPSRNGIGASLLLGHSGVYLVASLIYEALGKCSISNSIVISIFGWSTNRRISICLGEKHLFKINNEDTRARYVDIVLF